jgi:mono/diheme cytochrome c family protein
MSAQADRHLTWRHVAVPLLVFAYVSAMVFTLAKLHPFTPDSPAVTTTPTAAGDAARGETVFDETCASCHGAGGTGGIGPVLAGRRLDQAAARAQIVNGGGVMPANLVAGQDLDDVLAYLAQIGGS